VIEVLTPHETARRVTAVHDVSFRVERGEILGFLGPNGGRQDDGRCGFLDRLMPATEGKAIVGRGSTSSTSRSKPSAAPAICPRRRPLYPDMSVSEYLDFVAKNQGVPSAERRARVQYVMGRTRITDMANRLCGKLSEGI